MILPRSSMQKASRFMVWIGLVSWNYFTYEELQIIFTSSSLTISVIDYDYTLIVWSSSLFELIAGHGGSDGLHAYVHSLDYAVNDMVCFLEGKKFINK